MDVLSCRDPHRLRNCRGREARRDRAARRASRRGGVQPSGRVHEPVARGLPGRLRRGDERSSRLRGRRRPGDERQRDARTVQDPATQRSRRFSSPQQLGSTAVQAGVRTLCVDLRLRIRGYLHRRLVPHVVPSWTGQTAGKPSRASSGSTGPGGRASKNSGAQASGHHPWASTDHPLTWVRPPGEAARSPVERSRTGSGAPLARRWAIPTTTIATPSTACVQPAPGCHDSGTR